MMSRREHTKSQRRALLMDVASNLVRTSGMASVTIRSVAAQAGLSPTTVYNLFGSKIHLIIAILARDLETASEQLTAQESDDPLENFFAYTRVQIDRYGADPDFFRAVLFPNVNTQDPAPILEAMRAPRFRNLHRYVLKAIECGVLKKGSDPRVATNLISQCMAGPLIEWAAGAKSISQTRGEIQLACAAALICFARPAAAKKGALQGLLHGQR